MTDYSLIHQSEINFRFKVSFQTQYKIRITLNLQRFILIKFQQMTQGVWISG